MSGTFRFRPESFGGIVSMEQPPLLAYVDRALARRLGQPEHPSWVGEEDPDAPLSAPTEVHLLLTGRCPSRCTYCYSDSGPEGHPGPGPDQAKRMLEALARMQVFHVALGGGESLLREDLFELAAYARTLGLVPNLTTSGMGVDGEIARRCRVFGQVNVSVDGVGPLHRESRGETSFGAAARALEHLVAAGVPAGINTVLNRTNIETLEALVAWAAEAGANEVELLRLKPAGRAKAIYLERRLTDEQHRSLLPRVLALAERHRIHVKLDCSFAPMICWHQPPLEVLKAFSVVGCDGGGSLGAILPDGAVSGCSFQPSEEREGERVDAHWLDSPVLERFRAWPERALEPCRSCVYRRVCKGGCHVVAAFAGEGFETPDPECPRVIAYRQDLAAK